MKKRLIVAIDGPAASGKSTAAKYLAEKLGYIYLDTGAMYRAITYWVLKNDLLHDEEAIVNLMKSISLTLKFKAGLTQVFINGEEVTDKIRTPEVNKFVSEVSRISEVRKELVIIQRKLGKDGGLVAEGRDITTVVFPNADLKIYLTASLDARVSRRHKEFLENDESITEDEIKTNLVKRDKIDSTRDVSPLTKSEDAYEIDTTNMTVKEEIEAMLEKIIVLENIKV